MVRDEQRTMSQKRPTWPFQGFVIKLKSWMNALQQLHLAAPGSLGCKRKALSRSGAILESYNKPCTNWNLITTLTTTRSHGITAPIEVA
jgi:hypothetical protein